MKYTQDGWKQLQRKTQTDRTALFLEQILVPVGQQMFREMVDKNRKDTKKIESSIFNHKGRKVNIGSVFKALSKTPAELRSDTVLRESVRLYYKGLRLRRLLQTCSLLQRG